MFWCFVILDSISTAFSSSTNHHPKTMSLASRFVLPTLNKQELIYLINCISWSIIIRAWHQTRSIQLKPLPHPLTLTFTGRRSWQNEIAVCEYEHIIWIIDVDIDDRVTKFEAFVGFHFCLYMVNLMCIMTEPFWYKPQLTNVKYYSIICVHRRTSTKSNREKGRFATI
jgi:hypothetical protein